MKELSLPCGKVQLSSLSQRNARLHKFKDIGPISLTPIISKVFESIVLDWVEYFTETQINDDQFGCIKGSSTVDALVEIVHKWYEATDTLGIYVRILLLDFSKAFDFDYVDYLLIF